MDNISDLDIAMKQTADTRSYKRKLLEEQEVEEPALVNDEIRKAIKERKAVNRKEYLLKSLGQLESLYFLATYVHKIPMNVQVS